MTIKVETDKHGQPIFVEHHDEKPPTKTIHWVERWVEKEPTDKHITEGKERYEHTTEGGEQYKIIRSHYRPKPEEKEL